MSKDSIKNSITDIEEEEEKRNESEIDQLSLEIESYFVAKRGRGLDVGAEDFQAMRQMVVDRIPLDLIKQTIDKAFLDYKPRHRLDYIRSFIYCAPRCYDAFTRHKERASLKEPVPSEPFALGQPRKTKLQQRNEDAKRRIKEAEDRERKRSEETFSDHREHVQQL